MGVKCTRSKRSLELLKREGELARTVDAEKFNFHEGFLFTNHHR